MPTIEEEIKAVEEELTKTEYNKKTEGHIGKLKAKIARLKIELEKRRTRPINVKTYALRQTGDATVAIMGPPNVGKSSILNMLTGATSEVADYDFTTLEPHPGVILYKGAEIQLVDMPGIVKGAARGKGRGKEVLACSRNVEMVMIMIDVNRPDLRMVIQELNEMGIRLNRTRPDIVIAKRAKGGLSATSTLPLTHITLNTVKEMVKAYGILNADIVVRSDIDQDDLIDHLDGNMCYIPGLVVLNKVDLVGPDAVKKVVEAIGKDKNVFPFSVTQATPEAIEALKQKIWDTLGFIRVYLKPKGGKPDKTKPMIIRRGDTIGTVCKKIHKDFVRKFRYAVVTGRSVRFADQTVGLTHKLIDEDVVTLIVER
jgi:hypothetical protein